MKPFALVVRRWFSVAAWSRVGAIDAVMMLPTLDDPWIAGLPALRIVRVEAYRFRPVRAWLPWWWPFARAFYDVVVCYEAEDFPKEVERA